MVPVSAASAAWRLLGLAFARSYLHPSTPPSVSAGSDAHAHLLSVVSALKIAPRERLWWRFALSNFALSGCGVRAGARGVSRVQLPRPAVSRPPKPREMRVIKKG